MFRGRAAVTLASKAHQHPSGGFERCENEDLRNPAACMWTHLDMFTFARD
jgi:hypothetical protein